MFTQDLKKKVEKKIVFDTPNAVYFREMKKLLEYHGYVIVDSGDRKAYNKDTPRLVYGESTADTMQTIKALIISGHSKSDLCCALLDRKEGLQDLSMVNNELNLKKVPFVSTAVLYDDLFRQVRISLRAGKTPEQIQQELDIKFGSVTDMYKIILSQLGIQK